MALWAYFLENRSSIYEVNNTPLFELIRDCALSEDSIFVDDMGGGREGLNELFEAVQSGDVVMIRSLIDLADTGIDLIKVLHHYLDLGVEVVSVEECWYEHKGGLEKVECMVGIMDGLVEKKRRLGMEKAKAAGRMGRKIDKAKGEQMRKMRTAGLTVREITELCGVSRSTFYRRVGKNEDY